MTRQTSGRGSSKSPKKGADAAEHLEKEVVKEAINEIVKEASFTKFVEISEKYQNMIQLTLNEKITFVDVKMKNSESF